MSNAFSIVETTDLAALGSSAVTVNLPTKITEASGVSPSGPLRLASTALVTNTHATQTVFARWGADASATVYDFRIDGDGVSPFIEAPRGETFLSVFASGASTPVSVQFGNLIKD